LRLARPIAVRIACGLGFCAPLGAALLVASVAGAQAQKRTAIAVVSGGGGPELAARLRAELSAIGWRVIEVEPQGEGSLAQLARRAGTLAVVRVASQGDGIEVWVGPEVAAEATSEWIDVDSAEPSLSVVRAVEALRARFLELGIEPEPKAPEPPEPTRPADMPAMSRPAPPPSPQPPESPPSDAAAAPAAPSVAPPVWLRAQGAAIYSAGGLGLTPEIALGGQVRLYGSWSVGAEFWFPPVTPEVEASAGSARVRLLFAALSSEYRFVSGAFGAGLAAGVAVSRLDFDGSPEADFLSRDAHVVTWLPFARGLLSVRISGRSLLRLDAGAGPSFPRVRLQFAGEDVAAWGRPAAFAALGLEWGVGD